MNLTTNPADLSLPKEGEGSELRIGRRTFAFALITLVGVGLAGIIWGIRPHLTVNDQSRWNTVWSLVEDGTYEIDTQRQFFTIDKVDRDGKEYSSKPPLLPTMMAGFVLAIKPLVGLPFSSRDPKFPDDRTKGSIYLYGPLCLFVFQLLPFLVALWLYARYLDRIGVGSSAYMFCMLTAAVGTYLTGYQASLNNHVIAAAAAWITAIHAARIWYEGHREAWRFALVGLMAGWTAANEYPAGVFVIVILALALWIDWRRCLIFLVPPLALVTFGVFYTNYLAIGSLTPAYMQKDLYGGYWLSAPATPTTPLPENKPGEPIVIPPKSGIDALNDAPEPYWVYFVHLTVGHHGIFTLTPIWILAVWGACLNAMRRDERLPGLIWPILLVSTIVFGFYWLMNDQRNYGGFCQGARWLLWLGPLWLLLLPLAMDDFGRRAATWPGRLAGFLLAISVFSAMNALVNPWTRAWLHRILFFFQIVDY